MGIWGGGTQPLHNKQDTIEGWFFGDEQLVRNQFSFALTGCSTNVKEASLSYYVEGI